MSDWFILAVLAFLGLGMVASVVFLTARAVLYLSDEVIRAGRPCQGRHRTRQGA